ncbi:MAG: DUF364 domain-containing protein [Rugosibacter sp.]|nr:DUF364 domain-containing protein [Rugosibacter sp.]
MSGTLAIPLVRHWLVAAAKRIDATLGPARIESVVLPPLLVDPGQMGEFCAVQLDDGSIGVAFALFDDTLDALYRRDPAVTFRGRAAVDVAAGYGGDDGALRTLGLATINALTQRLFARAGFVPDAAVDSFGTLALTAGDRLGMVGFFPPLVAKARALDVPVTVLELKPELVREEPGLTVTLDAARLAGCNKIVSTSTLLLNDTFELLAPRFRAAQAVALVGPTAGCLPDPLFAAGVTAVGGSRVVAADAFLARCAAGERWGETTRKFTLTAAHYPGFENLLARARGA